MSKVPVYRFRGYDINSDAQPSPSTYATLEAIKQFGCVPLLETEIYIEESKLDGNGKYKQAEG